MRARDGGTVSANGRAAMAGADAERDTLTDLFSTQAARTPDAVALSFEDQNLTYAELAARSDRIAARLIAAGVGPETIVGVCLERSLELIAVIVGVLKAGGAYLPLDPGYPQDRLAFMISDAEAKVTVATTRTAAMLPDNIALLLLDEEALAEDGSDPAFPSRSRTTPRSLAYVIYTSGSTGRPKGVCIEHRNVVRLFRQTDKWFGFNADDVWTLFHSYAFDFSVWEIWGALLYGGRLVVVPQDTTRAPPAFLALLSRERVTVLNQTPSAFAQLMRADADEPEPPPLSLRTIIFGGEALDPARLRDWYARRGDSARLVNMYGITETTVHVTYKPLSPEIAMAAAGASPIGWPIPDLQAYVMDDRQHPVPVGITGELYIGGAGLARGYLRRPDLTAARFIPDPEHPGERLYRTGDLALWREDGELEFFGRADHQVKIRGFRIELGEIEAALLTHPAIRDTAVATRHDPAGQPQLVAYVVTGEDIPSAMDLRAHLLRTLPDHMVPGIFEKLAELPLTENGKLDRAALAARKGMRLPTGLDYTPPRTPAERELASIWAQALRLERVGVEENFFDLGGTSLLMAEVHARVRTSLAPRVTVVELFQYPNIRTLAARLTEAGPDNAASEARTRAARQAEALAKLRRVNARANP